MLVSNHDNNHKSNLNSQTTESLRQLDVARSVLINASCLGAAAPAAPPWWRHSNQTDREPPRSEALEKQV